MAAAASGLGIVVCLTIMGPPESLCKKMEEKKNNNNHEENDNDNNHDLAGYINGCGLAEIITGGGQVRHYSCFLEERERGSLCSNDEKGILEVIIKRGRRERVDLNLPPSTLDF